VAAQSMPVFWLGLMLILFFGVQLRSRELTGYKSAGLGSIFWNVSAVK